MTESEQSLNESLSAAIDGEADELELRRVLNAANEDADLRAKWQRMHLIGSVMRRETLPLITAPLPAWPATVDAMPDYDDADANLGPIDSGGRARRRMGGRWLAPLGSAALAAAAALVVVLYFGPRQQETPLPAVAERPQAPVTELANVPTELDIQRANAYIYRHARQTSIAARPAAMPFAKVLSTANDDAGEPDAERRDDTAAGRQRQ